MVIINDLKQILQRKRKNTWHKLGSHTTIPTDRSKSKGNVTEDSGYTGSIQTHLNGKTQNPNIIMRNICQLWASEKDLRTPLATQIRTFSSGNLVWHFDEQKTAPWKEERAKAAKKPDSHSKDSIRTTSGKTLTPPWKRQASKQKTKVVKIYETTALRRPLDEQKNLNQERVRPSQRG